MKIILQILTFLIEFIKSILYQWVLLLIKLITVFIQKMVAFCRKRKLPRAERKEVDKRCVTIHSPAYHKPDPLLYSQYFLMSKGLAVTWDNPDIRLKRNGVYVDSSKLAPATEYEVEAQIWNNSIYAPAPDMPVRFSYLDFGIGTTPIFISQTTVDLGVKGSGQCPAYAKSIWKTPDTPGHYCLQVLLQWSDDAEPNNNLGQENTNVGIFQSPVDFTFTIKNRKKVNDTIHFEVDTYTIPPLMDCAQEQPKVYTSRIDPLKRHRRSNYPIPEGWSVEVVPEKIDLLPNQEEQIKVRITPPDGFTGEKTFNINGFDLQDNLMGGVTLFTKTKN